MTVIFPGTFDPITNGHVDLVARAAKMFGRVIVAVAENARKKPNFDIQTRIALAKESLSAVAKVEVLGFSNLLVDFVRAQNGTAIIRGLRAVSDFEYEFQLANMNRRLAPDIETVFLTPDAQFSFVASSLVMEIAELGGDITSFVPPCVAKRISRGTKNN